MDVTAYLTESSSDVDSQVEIDPKEELRAMETRRGQASTPVSTHETIPKAVAMDEANEATGSAEEQDEEQGEGDDEEPTACAACHQPDNEKQILLCDGCEAGT